ncbi:MAG: hypothetical protein LBI45_00445, partial [Bacteroidales bacterium]|nr:hypothetical protein [Bacteroidales bacterium]
MKRIITFLLITAVFIVGKLQAQEQPFTQIIDSIFQHVSRVDATTGILYNRVLPFSGLCRFVVPDTSNSEMFKQAYSELYEATFDPNK